MQKKLIWLDGLKVMMDSLEKYAVESERTTYVHLDALSFKCRAEAVLAIRSAYHQY